MARYTKMLRKRITKLLLLLINNFKKLLKYLF